MCLLGGDNESLTDGSRFKIQVASYRWVRGRLMSVYGEQMVMSVHLSSHGLVTKVSWLCWTAPWTSKCRDDVRCNKVSYTEKEPDFRTTLSWSKIMIRPTQPDALGISWRTRTWKLWIGHSKVRIWSSCRVECVLALLLSTNSLRCHLSLLSRYIIWKKKYQYQLFLLPTFLIDSCYPDTTADCLHLPEITHTGDATPELVTFGVETHSSHPRPRPHSGTGVNSSSDDWNETPKLKSPSKEKKNSMNWPVVYIIPKHQFTLDCPKNHFLHVHVSLLCLAVAKFFVQNLTKKFLFLPIKTQKLILTLEWYYRSLYCRSNAMIKKKMANLKAITSSATLTKMNQSWFQCLKYGAFREIASPIWIISVAVQKRNRIHGKIYHTNEQFAYWYHINPMNLKSKLLGC